MIFDIVIVFAALFFMAFGLALALDALAQHRWNKRARKAERSRWGTK